MSKMKMLMLVNSTNENLCEFLPNDCPQTLISEFHDVSKSLKKIPSQGSIQTNQNKFAYKQYNPSGKNSKEEDVLVLFICTDLKYKDNLISKFFDEIFDSLSLKNYSNYKLNPESKKKIAKIFYKYQDENKINKENVDLENHNLEFGTLNDFTSLDIINKNRRSNSISLYGLESFDEKDNKTLHRRGEKRVPLEINKIRKWKTLKCIFLFINIIMIVFTFFLLYYFLSQPEKE